MRPDPKAEGLRWLRQAEHDLSDADYSRAGGRYSLACFLCQQAAEMALGDRGGEEETGREGIGPGHGSLPGWPLPPLREFMVATAHDMVPGPSGTNGGRGIGAVAS